MSNHEIVGTVKAGQLLGVSQQSVRKWCQSGMLKAKNTPGGFYKIEVSELERFKETFNMPDVEPVNYALIIDDDSDRIKFFGGLLEMMGFKVVTAWKILDIGISIGKVNPDLIVAGAGVPGLAIVDLLSQLKDTREVPFLAITKNGVDLEEIIAPFRRDIKIRILPVSDPFDVQQFKSKVTALLQE